MRISDWRSDVCSSDLGGRAGALIEEAAGAAVVAVGRRQIVEAGEIGHFANRADRGIEIGAVRGNLESHFAGHAREIVGDRHGEDAVARVVGRSEEHTSELQPLMRDSYVVSCSTNKNG